MKGEPNRRPIRRWQTGAALLLCAAAGVALRLYNIRGQVLVDDEWHGIYYSIGKSLWHLLTRFSVYGANSIPLNLYFGILLRTSGWTELALRMPALLAGAVSLIVLPLIARRLVSHSIAVPFAVLLAISPFLVFYSRLCRPFSIVVLLGTTSILVGSKWLAHGRPRDAALYAATAVLTIHAHLFAAPAVAGPMVCAAAALLLRTCVPGRHKAGTNAQPGLRQTVATAAGMALGLGLLVLPALARSMGDKVGALIAAGYLKSTTLPDVLGLVSGTANPLLQLIVLALAAIGLAHWLRSAPLLAAPTAAAIALQCLAVAVLRPHAMHSPLVLLRYCILLVPLVLLLAAQGLAAVCSLFRPGRTEIAALAGTALGAALFIAGPWPHRYIKTNSFTNHSAYQQSYAPINWDASYERAMHPRDFKTDLTIDAGELSPFYAKLAHDRAATAIVEFPMTIGDHFNPLYYYQHFHRKRVIIGYIPTMEMRAGPAHGRHVFGNYFVDEVLSGVADPSKLRLRNMTDLTDPDALVGSGADYVVLHKQFEAELSQIYGRIPGVEELTAIYRDLFGEAVYEDGQLVAFALPRPNAPGTNHARRR